MTINAVTGQVWRIEVATIQTRTVTFTPLLHMPISRDKIDNILDAFISGLGIHLNDRAEPRTINIIESDESVPIHEIHFGTIRARQSFAEGDAAVIITASGTPVTNEMGYIRRFNILLTASPYFIH